MNEFIKLIIEFILSTLMYGLVIWVTGLLFIAVFKINFEWNFLRALGVSFILMILKNIFSGSNKNENN